MRQLFEQEYPKHEKSLFLVALSYLHNTEDAKDVLQEALLSAYKNIHTLRNREYFKTWLTRIVINKSKNFLKAKRYTEELSDNLNVFYALPEQDMEIMDALCRMDPQLSVYISLRFYNDMNYDEAAKALNQPVSTVKYRTRKALGQLKTLLEGETMV
ncbi:MAG: sigma-70 family RNA polymerase sigma factor [Oscillospiraceae bacterium]|nr:sigma-70 family RNA polymerase sigma factor [Oscillospiraceae bacterium]